MAEYGALDVSLKETSVCILDESGAVVFEGRCPSHPTLLAQLIAAKAPRVARVGLETGPTSIWLYHQLVAAGLPVVCLDARQARAALSVRPTKTDRTDARGLADMVRMGWYREVQVKSMAAQEQRALLITRHRLVAMRRELDNQIRGLCSNRSAWWWDPATAGALPSALRPWPRHTRCCHPWSIGCSRSGAPCSCMLRHSTSRSATWCAPTPPYVASSVCRASGR